MRYYIALILVGVVACLAVKQGAAVSAYEAQELRCVDLAETSAQATACRNAVKAAWAADAGGE